MRAALPSLAAMSLLAACANQAAAPPVAASVPTVSYRIDGTDVTQANVTAASYCQQYGGLPQLQGIQSTGSGNLAVYTCASAAASSPPAVVPMAGSSVSPMR